MWLLSSVIIKSSIWKRNFLTTFVQYFSDYVHLKFIVYASKHGNSQDINIFFILPKIFKLPNLLIKGLKVYWPFFIYRTLFKFSLILRFYYLVHSTNYFCWCCFCGCPIVDRPLTFPTRAWSYGRSYWRRRPNEKHFDTYKTQLDNI